MKEEFLSRYAWLSVTGVLAGALSGLLGIGAGTVIVPSLVMLGFGQKSAQGTALGVMVPMALVGAFTYWRRPEADVDVRVVLLVALFAVAGTLAGSNIALSLPEPLLKKMFGGFLLVVGLKMLMW